MRLLARTVPLLLIALALPAGPARAQFTTAPTLTLDGARLAAEAARARAEALGLHVAIAVVDASGTLLYFERLPGTQAASVDIAIGKARTAVHFRRSTALLEEAVAGGRLALLALDLVPFEGGVPVWVAGEVAGAIGVSGATPAEDGIVAAAGLEALRPPRE